VAQQTGKRAERRRQEDEAASADAAVPTGFDPAAAAAASSATAAAAASSAPVRACALGDDDIHSACSSTRTPKPKTQQRDGTKPDGAESFLGAAEADAAAAATTDSDEASTILSLRSATLVIKEVPFQGLSPQEQQDILNEVRVMSAVNHQAFVAYYESFLDNGCLYIVMELAEGGDLAQLLQANKPQSVQHRKQHEADFCSY
jgi:serine/threonine protein kinase